MSPRFANAKALLVNYLRLELALRDEEVLDGIVVGSKVPPSRDISGPPLLVVRRSGGPATWPVLDLPRLDFMSWHITEFKAESVAAIVRELIMFDLPGRVLEGHTVYRVREFSGPTTYPDPAGSSVDIVMFTSEIAVRIA